MKIRDAKHDYHLTFNKQRRIISIKIETRKMRKPMAEAIARVAAEEAMIVARALPAVCAKAL